MIQIEEITDESQEITTTTTTTTRKLSVPRLVLLLICGAPAIYYLVNLVSIFDSTEHDEEDSNWMSKRVQEIERARKAEEDFQIDFKRSLNSSDNTELFMGNYRYKLFHRPRLPFNRAVTYCKDMDGKLPLMENVETPRKIQQLVGHGKPAENFDAELGLGGYGYPNKKGAVWVGRKKIKKPKKPKKKPDADGENPDDAEENYRRSMMMDPMMMGGGGGRGEKMCPAITPRNLYVPVECHSPMSFVCEFDRSAPRKPLPKNKKYSEGGRYGRHMDMGRPDRDMEFEPPPIEPAEHDEL